MPRGASGFVVRFTSERLSARGMRAVGSVPQSGGGGMALLATLLATVVDCPLAIWSVRRSGGPVRFAARRV